MVIKYPFANPADCKLNAWKSWGKHLRARSQGERSGDDAKLCCEENNAQLVEIDSWGEDWIVGNNLYANFGTHCNQRVCMQIWVQMCFRVLCKLGQNIQSVFAWTAC